MNDDSPDDLTARRRKRERATTTPEPCGLCSGEQEVTIECPECTDPVDWVKVEVDAPPTVRVKLLRPTAQAPRYMTDGAAGADVFADLGGGECGPSYFSPEHTHKIPLGFAVEIPPGWVGILKGRSGLAAKGHEGHVAAIDSDYRGEVCMLLHVSGVDTHGMDLRIEHGDRVGQILFMPAPQATLDVVDELSDTARGQGGFGSTGVR
jgi:dUTP pyrophosphatase